MKWLAVICLFFTAWVAGQQAPCSSRDFGVAYYGNTIFTISSANNTCACLSYHSAGPASFGSVTTDTLAVSGTGNTTSFAGRTTFGDTAIFASSATFGGNASFAGTASFGAPSGSCTTSLSDALVYRLDGTTGRDAGPYMIASSTAALCNQTVGGVSGVCMMSGSNYLALNLSKVVAYFPTGRAARSICSWGYLTAAVGKQWMFSYGTNSTGNSMFIGALGSSGDFGSTNDDMPAGTWSPGVWNHICGVYDGITARFYFNGQQVLSAIRAWSIPTSPLGANIGSHVDGNENWHGSLYDVRVYARSLAASEVLTLYRATQGNVGSSCAYLPSGPSVFYGAVMSVGGLSTGSDSTTTLAGRLVVPAQSEFHGTATFTAPVIHTGNVRLDSSAALTVNGNLLVNGLASFTAPLTLSAGLTVSGDVTASSFTGDGRNLQNLSLAPDIAALKALVANQSAAIAALQAQVSVLTAPAGHQLNPSTSCKAILLAAGTAPSGVYWLDLTGGSRADAFAVYCDMTTDGGGWTMVLNYVHGTNNPNVVPWTNALPLLGSSTLGVDESSTTANWGHGAPVLMNQIAFTEVRFFCQGAYVGRVAHFKTANANVISAIKTGSGSMYPGIQSYTAMAGHNAGMPGTLDAGAGTQGDLTLTNFPFYRSATYHWGIKGGGTRWECDDYTNSASYATIHRVWVR